METAVKNSFKVDTIDGETVELISYVLAGETVQDKYIVLTCNTSLNETIVFTDLLQSKKNEKLKSVGILQSNDGLEQLLKENNSLKEVIADLQDEITLLKEANNEHQLQVQSSYEQFKTAIDNLQQTKNALYTVGEKLFDLWEKTVERSEIASLIAKDEQTLPGGEKSRDVIAVSSSLYKYYFYCGR